MIRIPFALLSAGVAAIAAGCPTTNVSLGKLHAGSGGTSGTVSVGGVGGDTGSAGTGVGGMSGVSTCAPTEETLRTCAFYLPFGDMPNDTYGYNACLNGFDGVGGAAAAQCEGYAPCSYQHEECLFYKTDGTAGASDLGCAGAPGDADWLEDCGGLGYYGSDIIDPATGGAGGESGMTAPAAGESGSAGMTAGVGGVGGG